MRWFRLDDEMIGRRGLNANGAEEAVGVEGEEGEGEVVAGVGEGKEDGRWLVGGDDEQFAGRRRRIIIIRRVGEKSLEKCREIHGGEGGNRGVKSANVGVQF